MCQIGTFVRQHFAIINDETNGSVNPLVCNGGCRRVKSGNVFIPPDLPFIFKMHACYLVASTCRWCLSCINCPNPLIDICAFLCRVPGEHLTWTKGCLVRFEIVGGSQTVVACANDKALFTFWILVGPPTTRVRYILLKTMIPIWFISIPCESQRQCNFRCCELDIPPTMCSFLIFSCVSRRNAGERQGTCLTVCAFALWVECLQRSTLNYAHAKI